MLAIDNKLPFLITISKIIQFGTVEFLPNRTQTQVLAAILSAKKLHSARQFTVLQCHADLEFEPLEDDLHDNGIKLNLAMEGEHVPEIE